MQAVNLLALTSAAESVYGWVKPKHVDFEVNVFKVLIYTLYFQAAPAWTRNHVQ